MAVFRFRLQSVLDQRLAEERRAQRRVADVEIERIGLESRLREINGSIQNEKDEWRGRIGGAESSRVDLRGARMQAGASISLIAEAQRTVLRLAGVHKRFESVRGELLEATTRRRAVELLRDKYHEAWLRDLNKRESAVQDDMAVMRYGRGESLGSEVFR
ncbi:MAG: flagellar export protein FliJ [Phycisphaerales bacterium]|jgi:flagellar export protein FliJ